MSGAPFGDEELDLIRRMWVERCSGARIASALAEAGFHRTRNSVIGIVHRMGFQRPEASGPEPAPPKRTANKKAPPKKSPPLAEPEPVPTPSQPRPLAPAGGVALVDLEHWHCRRIVAEQPYRFCGKEKAFGTSWCSACCERVFTAEGMARLLAGRKPPQRMKAAA